MVFSELWWVKVSLRKWDILLWEREDNTFCLYVFVLMERLNSFRECLSGDPIPILESPSSASSRKGLACFFSMVPAKTPMGSRPIPAATKGITVFWELEVGSTLTLLLGGANIILLFLFFPIENFSICVSYQSSISLAKCLLFQGWAEQSLPRLGGFSVGMVTRIPELHTPSASLQCSGLCPLVAQMVSSSSKQEAEWKQALSWSFASQRPSKSIIWFLLLCTETSEKWAKIVEYNSHQQGGVDYQVNHTQVCF